MKKSFRLISVALAALCLSSCDLFGKLTKPSYSGYEEYFQKELKYTKYTDMTALNNKIAETSYFWTTNTGNDYTAYYTGKSVLIMVYNDSKATISFTDGTGLRIEKKNDVTTIRTTNRLNDKHVSYDSSTDQKTVAGDVDENSLNVAKDNGGFLVVAFQKYMLYVTSDIKNVYMNENNTKVFQGYTETKTVPDSELLATTLAVLGQDKRLQLPAPSNEFEIWYGETYYKDHVSHTTAYLAGVNPNDYVKVLEQNGFTVIRSWEDPYYAFYSPDGGYWYCYDEKQEIEILMKMEYYLYVNNLGQSYGPWQNTCMWFYRMDKGYFGEKTRTTKTEWSDYDKADMAGWYDGTIDATKVPFIQLGEGYNVPSASLMSYAHEGLLDGKLKLHSQCYNIYDNSPVYFLDGYDQTLEANGFHKYVPEVNGKKYDLSNNDDRYAFGQLEESKYVECFINDEEDIAVKYYFDVNNGNTIRVFKKSEMQSWLQDEK